jgi:DNA-binding GntR family transcriptional regulator
VRQLARRVGVSVYTITSAFERLSAKGLIDARAGAGYFVAPLRSRGLAAGGRIAPGLLTHSNPREAST